MLSIGIAVCLLTYIILASKLHMPWKQNYFQLFPIVAEMVICI